MNIHCPNCNYERSIEEAKLPASACMATCPKCACRFKFRDLRQGEALATPPSESMVAPAQPIAQSNTIEASTAQSGMSEASNPAPIATEVPKEHTEPQSPISPISPTVLHEKTEPQSTPTPEPVQAEAKEDAPTIDKENSGDNKKDIWDDISTTVNRWQEQPSQTSEGAKARSADRREQEADAHAVPWERLDQYGFFQGLMLTIKQASLAPAAFFGKLVPSTQATRPLSFFVLLGVFQAIMERLWYITTFNTLSNTVSDPHLQNVLSNITHDTNFFVTLLVSPFLLTLQLFIIAGLYYLMFRFVRPEKADFTLIFRVICYAAAPTIVCVVPFFGSIFASFIFLVWTVIGCKHALHMPWSRTLMAVAPLYLLALAGILQVIKTLLLSIPT